MKKEELSAHSINRQVATYTSQRDLYSAFASKLNELLQSLLDDASVPYHVVESRAKTIESFREKITRSGKSYSDPMTELPDLCGCRVITYYADDVGKIGEILKSDFDVIEEELAHQPAGLEADRFGYLSAHYVLRLSDNRFNLGEWRAFAGLRAEVQVRTVIQHAWSAVSHALQYKQETGIPSSLQRRLYRIAGLFELADEEFVGIREQKAMSQRVADAAIKSGSTAVPLSTSSIPVAIENWELIENVRKAAAKAGFTVPGDPDYDPGDLGTDLVPDIYSLASKAGISTTEDLMSSVTMRDVSIFTKLFDREEDESGWNASDNFLFCLMLINRFKNLVTSEDFKKHMWSPEIYHRVLASVRSTRDRKS